MAEILNQQQIDQIKKENDARMASFSNKSTTSSVPDTGGSDAFMKELQNRLFSSLDIVSSSNTGVEQAISEAVSATKGAQEAGASKIESQYGAKIADIQKQGQQQYTSALESQRGFATNTAALKSLTDNTDKQVKEYEQMKQEALLQNNTAFASQLANLQLQALQFKQEAQQQTFNNMLQVAGLGVQISAEERAGQQFQQNLDLQRQQLEASRQSDMMSLAANAGVQLTPGETYESLSKKISNSAITSLQKQKLQLEIENLKSKSDSSQTDYFANSIVSREISAGKTATDAASTAIFELTNLYGADVPTEQRNQIINSALLLEEQYKTSVQEQVNNTANTQNQVSETLQSTGLFDGLINFVTGTTPEERDLRAEINKINSRLRLAGGTEKINLTKKLAEKQYELSLLVMTNQ